MMGGLLDEHQQQQLTQRIRERGDARMNELLDALPYDRRRVLELRCGLADGHQYTVEETAMVFAMPVSWVVGIETNALAQIHEMYEGPSSGQLAHWGQ